MAGLVGRDLREAVADPEREAGLLEVGLAVLCQAARVEGVLEVLKGERELEDVRVCAGGSIRAMGRWGQEEGGGQRRSAHR